MARVDRGGEEAVAAARGQRGEKRGQRRDAENRNAGRKTDRAGGRNADPQARIAAGTDRHGDAVETGEPALDRRDDPVDQRQKRLGVTALHRDRLPRERLKPVPVDDAGRAGSERRIDGEDTHELSDNLRTPHAKQKSRRRTGGFKPRPLIIAKLWRKSVLSGQDAGCAAAPTRPQTASTSRTSGRKWRRRFWMPCFSVAVEDGQPAHEPFMLR